MTRDPAGTGWMTTGDAELLRILTRDMSEEEQQHWGSVIARNEELTEQRWNEGRPKS